MGPSASPAEHPQRSYAEVGVVSRDGGFAVALDSRTAETLASHPLVLPTEPLARLLADEWAAQGETLDPTTMPATRLAFTVIDRTAGAGAALAVEVARYAGADVLCYFAEAPDALVERQVTRWIPVLDWARHTLGVSLERAVGLMPRPQPPEALARVRALVEAMEPFDQAGVAFASPLFGSAVLALALQRGALDADTAFDLSRLDEAFQAERWGVDAEAADRIAGLREEARLLGRWFRALEG